MRRTISVTYIYELAARALRSSLAAQSSFTAYDITRMLRAFHPDVEIPHTYVRQAVHCYMSNVTQTGYYEAEWCEFDGAQALLYRPVVHDLMPNLSSISLN